MYLLSTFYSSYFNKVYNFYCHSRTNSSYIVEHLKDRSIVRISGAEAASFLQGLITNDIDHLVDNEGEGILLFTPSSNSSSMEAEEKADVTKPILHRSIYAMFLNTAGRVLFDVIIIALSSDVFLIDCHSDAAQKLVKHLKMYRVRKKIDITVADKSEIWSIFCKDILQPHDLSNRSMAEDFIGFGLTSNCAISTVDPRVKQLGYRISVFDQEKDVKRKLLSMNQASTGDYKELRIRLGVGECPSELQSGKALPLESNVDYLHGVSFHKGCYIGQELTARTHHTGVIRKRIMPLIISNPEGVSLELESNLVNGKTKKSVGKLKNYINNYGIGLMRIDDCLTAQNNEETIISSDESNISVKVLKPDWWPETSINRLREK